MTKSSFSTKPLRWLIAEDSLEDRNGHWFEYLMGFHRELPRLGDQVTWLVSRRATQEVISSFEALPVLPESAFRKVSDAAPSWRRYLRIPLHGWKTYRSLNVFLRRQEKIDMIFIPTVIVHHLLGWFFLVKTILKGRKTKVLFFFPNLPIRLNDSGSALDGSPTAHLTKKLLKGMAAEINSGQVILGVETLAMKRSAEEVFGVPFSYFPHPVAPFSSPSLASTSPASACLNLACYGAARFEKGSELLVSAIQEYLRRFPESSVKFIIQWIDDFSLPDGMPATVPDILRNHPSVQIIGRIFDEGEYEQWLATTDVLLLPYRSSSYTLRVSRVVIEALVNGIPVVVTGGTTMAQQMQEFGSGVTCENEDIESLVTAITEVVSRHESLARSAGERRQKASDHFSVLHFRKSLRAIE